MGNVLGHQAKKMSFAEMVESVVERKYLAPALSKLIIRLKDLRRESKHRGKEVSYQAIDELLPSILEASHRLVRIIKISAQQKVLSDSESKS